MKTQIVYLVTNNFISLIWYFRRDDDVSQWAKTQYKFKVIKSKRLLNSPTPFQLRSIITIIVVLSTGFDQSLMSNIQKLFSEKIEIFSAVEFSKVSILTGIIKITLKVGAFVVFIANWTV